LLRQLSNYFSFSFLPFDDKLAETALYDYST
jgi:hypothetical protein